MKIVTISDKAFNYYKKKVKGNRNITYDIACRKLTRNLILADRIPTRTEEELNKGNELYIYGNLFILKRGNRIIHLWNHKNTNAYANWELDRVKYVELSKELGIIE